MTGWKVYLWIILETSYKNLHSVYNKKYGIFNEKPTYGFNWLQFRQVFQNSLKVINGWDDKKQKMLIGTKTFTNLYQALFGANCLGAER